MLLADIQSTYKTNVLKSALILDRTLRAGGTAAQRTARSPMISRIQGAGSEQCFNTDFGWMDVNEATRVSSTCDPLGGSLQELAGAASWEITTERSPELEDILTPTSLFYVAYSTLGDAACEWITGEPALYRTATGKQNAAGCVDLLKNKLETLQ